MSSHSLRTTIFFFLSMFYFFWWFAYQRFSFLCKKVEFNRKTNPTVHAEVCIHLIYIDGEIKSDSTFKITSVTQVITGFQEIRLSSSFTVCAWYRCQWHWCMRTSLPLQIHCMYFMQDCFSFLCCVSSITVSLPRLVSPRPAEASMSRPTGQMRDGDGPLGAGFNTTGGEEDDTPLLSSPNRNFRASYMFTAFLSTLLTITDWEVEDEGKGDEKAKSKTGKGRGYWHQT